MPAWAPNAMHSEPLDHYAAATPWHYPAPGPPNLVMPWYYPAMPTTPPHLPANLVMPPATTALWLRPEPKPDNPYTQEWTPAAGERSDGEDTPEKSNDKLQADALRLEARAHKPQKIHTRKADWNSTKRRWNASTYT